MKATAPTTMPTMLPVDSPFDVICTTATGTLEKQPYIISDPYNCIWIVPPFILSFFLWVSSKSKESFHRLFEQNHFMGKL